MLCLVSYVTRIAFPTPTTAAPVLLSILPGGVAVDAIDALVAAREEAYLSDAGTGGGTDYDPFSETMASAPRPVLPTRTELAAVMDIHPTGSCRCLAWTVPGCVPSPISAIDSGPFFLLFHISCLRRNRASADFD